VVAVVDAILGDNLDLVYNFHVPLALKVGCDVALVFIFLCVGLMAISGGAAFFSGFLSSGARFAVSWPWCGASRLLVELLPVQVLLCVMSCDSNVV
jgi:hypothetical protein